VHKTLLTSWPLFFGLSMLMIGNGLQGTLLGVRASIEHFDTTAIGLIMSFYYVGFLAGSAVVPRLVVKVGHIRVFAAMASLASTTVLIHGLFPNPYLWCVVRILSGFSFAALFIVIESWLNNVATNKTRGQVMAVYLVILYASMVIGQFLLSTADPGQMELFVLTSVLISIALLPISLSSRPAPILEAPQRVSLKYLYTMSPLAVVGVFFSGLAASTLFGMGPVYGEKMGMTLPQISSFMAAFIAGGVLFQTPIGWLSDKFDRRIIFIGVTFLAAAISLCAYFVAPISYPALLVAMIFLGGMSLSIYALAIAHMNDHLGAPQIVAASASMIMINGVGSCLGPVTISALMAAQGTNAFYPMLSFIFALISAFGIYRTFRRAPVPLEEQGEHIPLHTRASPIIMQIAEESSDVMKKMGNS
jgi:MFS family permease